MDMLRWILLILGIAILVGIYLSGRMEKRRLPRERLDDLPEDELLEQIHIRADSRTTPVARAEPLAPAQVTPLSSGQPAAKQPSYAPKPSVKPQEPPRDYVDADELDAIEPEPDSESAKKSSWLKKPELPQKPDWLKKPDWSQKPEWLRKPKWLELGGAGSQKDEGAVEAEQPAEEKILILHVVAPQEKPFLGVQIQTAFQEVGLEHGAMSIYHRMHTPNHQPEILFSVANMVQPGTFDPEQMNEFKTPGVSFFLRLPGPDEPVQAFERMLDCAERLAQRLGGQVLDASRSAMTRQGREHACEEIRRWRLRANLQRR